uniref:Uncharacterized protein n=1 Tax=Anguilla anguilla TaxID=7936 RepID=A0A0E9TT88_ANGAN
MRTCTFFSRSNCAL